MKLYALTKTDGSVICIDEEKKKELLREIENIKLYELTMNISLIKFLLQNQQIWLSKSIYDRNKKQLEIELIILLAIEKIRNQLIMNPDDELVLTEQEKRLAKQIQQRMNAEGLPLKHDLTRLDENRWQKKIERDKSLLRDDNDLGRELI